MRVLRLGRTFDTVLVHDAIMYMTTKDDLVAAVKTAFIHTRSGGAAVFAPDYLRESFNEETHFNECNGGDRGVRYVEWVRDPDPNDTSYTVDYAFLLRDGVEVTCVHDQHVEGLFSKSTWLQILRDVGFEPSIFPRPRDDEGAVDEVFVCRKPGR